jgi:hypothetical protein
LIALGFQSAISNQQSAISNQQFVLANTLILKAMNREDALRMLS